MARLWLEERRAEKARLKKTPGALVANYPDVASGRHVVVTDHTGIV